MSLKTPKSLSLLPLLLLYAPRIAWEWTWLEKMSVQKQLRRRKKQSKSRVGRYTIFLFLVENDSWLTSLLLIFNRACHRKSMDSRGLILLTRPTWEQLQMAPIQTEFGRKSVLFKVELAWLNPILRNFPSLTNSRKATLLWERISVWWIANQDSLSLKISATPTSTLWSTR